MSDIPDDKKPSDAPNENDQANDESVPAQESSLSKTACGDTHDLFADDPDYALPSYVDQSPASSAQRQRLFAELIAVAPGGLITPYIRDELGVMQPAARIKELRLLGYNIVTERIGVEDAQGRFHSGVARYIYLGKAKNDRLQSPP
jgi:hypothetical protein